MIFHYYKNKYTSAQRRKTASSMLMPPGGSPHNSPPQPSLPPQSGGGRVDRLVIFHLQSQLTQLHNRATRNRNKPTIETPQMLLAGLCPGLGTCPRPAGGSSGQNVATLTRRQSLSSHPELCPGSWGQVPPDTNWSGGKRLPSQTGTGPPQGSLLVFRDQTGAAQPCLPG